MPSLEPRGRGGGSRVGDEGGSGGDNGLRDMVMACGAEWDEDLA